MKTKTSLVSVAVVATLVTALSLSIEQPSPVQPTTPTARAEGTKMLGRLPVAFVPNLGQWEHPAHYVTRVGAMTVFLEGKGWTFTLVDRPAQKEKWNGNELADEKAPARGVAVRMTFTNASEPELVAEDQLPGRHNYFLGNDPSKWRSGVPLYGAVRYREVHPGVDVRAREHDGHFEYDLLLQAGADLDPVEIVVEGIERMHVDKDGALVMETRLGPVRMPAPLSWEEGPLGERSLVTCRYVLRGEDRFGFEVTGRQPGWSLTVDPGLVWSTFLGGGSDDYALAVALDSQGAATVAGWTISADFPTTPGAFDASYNGSSINDGDAFVTRLSPSGSSLVYSTFLGGTSSDPAQALALDAQGAATVAGSTRSADFPTTPGAFDTTHNGGDDAFVSRLSPSGSSLVYSTFLGGMGHEVASGLALDAQGAPTVAGWTYSTNFPTTPGAFDTSYSGGEGFVTRFPATGSTLVYSTFLGGAFNDDADAIALDAQGAATVAGTTDSADFPTTSGAFDTSFNGAGGGGWDVFVARLSPLGTSLVYSTFLGGTRADSPTAIALDAHGAATITGVTSSPGFPTTPGAFDRTYSGSNDAFVTRLSPSGSSLVYSTLLGPTFNGAHALALDAQGAATVVGATGSTLPTTPGAFDTSHNGGFDAFVARLDMLPPGVAPFGNSSPGCTGPLEISFNSTPRVGNASFALGCGNAPPNAAGLILYTGNRFSSPLVVLGIEVWVDPSLLSVTGSASSNSNGVSEVPLAIPNGPALVGVRLFAQFAWAGPTSPAPCPPLGFSASNALDFTIQP